jgi:hypothetical protein
VVLSIPEKYYATPRAADSTISLKVRYADLTAPREFREGYDPSELVDPNWKISRSNYTALVQIYRHGLKRPTYKSDFQRSYPKLTEATTDWEGWTKLKECPWGCQQVFYINDAWRAHGVDHVLCYEVVNRDPLRLGCGSRDHVEGVLLDFYFPAVKKAHFEEFRDKIESFIGTLMDDATKNCATTE